MEIKAPASWAPAAVARWAATAGTAFIGGILIEENIRHLAEERLAQGTVVERVGAPEDEPLARDVRNRYLGLIIITDVVVMLVAMVADDVAGSCNLLGDFRAFEHKPPNQEKCGRDAMPRQDLQHTQGPWVIGSVIKSESYLLGPFVRGRKRPAIQL